MQNNLHLGDFNCLSHDPEPALPVPTAFVNRKYVKELYAVWCEYQAGRISSAEARRQCKAWIDKEFDELEAEVSDGFHRVVEVWQAAKFTPRRNPILDRALALLESALHRTAVTIAEAELLPRRERPSVAVEKRAVKRLTNALALMTREGLPNEASDGGFWVPSQSGEGVYLVKRRAGGHWRCECKATAVCVHIEVAAATEQAMQEVGE